MQASALRTARTETTRSLGSDLLALVADAVICTDESGRILLFNRAAEQAFGYAANQVLGKQVEMLLPQHYRDKHVGDVRSFAHESGTANRLMGHRREVCGRRKSGEEFPAEAMVSRQVVDGEAVLTVAVRDISERKELERQREMIVGELDHRVRNVLSVVKSLVRLGARDARSVEQFKQTLLGHLSALANTQNALRFGAQQSASLNELLLGELEQYRSEDDGNIVIEGEDVALEAGAAQKLALAIHELATNSAKYGALSVGGGCITIASALGDQAENGDLSIEWRETGGPPVVRPERQGFGTTLLQQIFGRTRGAKIETEYSPKGFVCRMTLPSATVGVA